MTTKPKIWIFCRKCDSKGEMSPVFKFYEMPRSCVSLYMPDDWRAFNGYPYCKKCSKEIIKAVGKLL